MTNPESSHVQRDIFVESIESIASAPMSAKRKVSVD